MENKIENGAELKKEWYLGLDIGTDSVGWAATDTNYNIPKFKGNAMWGIRLFDESNTAEERRLFRGARRRTQRKRERINLLQMLFDGEISKTDPAFYQRLSESCLYPEDKSVDGKYSVFSGSYTDKDFYADYPTIYHLRSELIHNAGYHDPRLVYLALHHLIKNRGHFLFDSLNTDDIDDFEPVYNDFVMYMKDNLEVSLECSNIDELASVLKNKKLSKTGKTAAITSLFCVDKKSGPQEYYLLSLLSGATADLYKIFDDESLKDAEKKKITFSGNFDDDAPVYRSILGERFEVIEKVKAVYDWAVLADILNGEKYISDAKVKVYEEHKNDLKMLKSYVRSYCPEKYSEIFKLTKSGLNNYVAYTAHIKKNGRTGALDGKKCNQEDFCAYLKKTLGQCGDESFSAMFSKIELGTFMPKQVNKDNGVIPMQINEKEVKAILKNASSYLDFLKLKDEKGLTVSDKIIAIFEYRIPYYVGPLNTHSKNAWVIRSNEKIYPWNCKEVVDADKTAEQFINNLTSKCTYLPEYDVIPKNSILYSKFTVLNELNNLKLDGKSVTVKLKQDIFNDLFKNYNKVTNKKLKNYLLSKGIAFDTITGIDGDFKSSLKSYRDLDNFDFTDEEKEEVIKAVTIFGDDKKLLKRRIRKLFGEKLTDDEIGKISRLKYSGWSSLSREFLTDIYCADEEGESGEAVNIITALWNTNLNLMQLLYSDRFHPSFSQRAAQMNRFDGNRSLKESVEELYVSPKVKRPIYQSLLITKELVKIQGSKPKKIFVEVARGEEKKERKVSRKTRLLELYKSCKKDNEELYESLLGEDDDRLRSDKLYFYYSQLGRDMYTGEPIDFGNLMGANSRYDIDHIFPRSKVKDDSLDNRVLVNKILNANKTNDYPLSQSIREKMAGFWGVLKQKKLISDKKYERLTRIYPLTDEELSAFVSRQLVETRQSTKAVAQILEELYPKPDTEIVYVKAALASDFRHRFDMLKCREVNDYHHAKDAYLNIVAGNVYNVKFTHNRRNFIDGLQQSGSRGFSLNRIYDYDTPGAWDKDKSLKIVKSVMNKNNIRYTRYSFKQNGGLFDQMLVKKGKGQVPIKASGAISDIKKYGAYNRPSSRYFVLVEYADKKGKEVRRLIPVDAYKEKGYLENPDGFASSITGFDTKVIIPCIKYNALLSFDGFRMHISSKTGTNIVYKPAVQLVLGYEKEKYIRNVIKYLTQFFSVRKVGKYDGITAEENIELYSAIVDKMLSNAFSWKFGTLGSKLKDKTGLFKDLSLEDQCYVIREVLKILHANVMMGDLTLIGEAKNTGRSSTNSKLSEIKNTSSIKLINQSVTGLYENEVELLK